MDYFSSKHCEQKQYVFPKHKAIMEEHYSSAMSGHFSSEKLMKFCYAMWWQGTYGDVIAHCRSCPQCAIVNASEKINQLLLHPLSAEQVLQIIGVDVIDLLLTDNGNHHVVVFQDFYQNGHWFFWFWIRQLKSLAHL